MAEVYLLHEDRRERPYTEDEIQQALERGFVPNESPSPSLIVIRSREEYHKTLKGAADIYLYDLREELSYCKGHQFISEIPEPVLIKIDDLIKAIDDYRNTS